MEQVLWVYALSTGQNIKPQLKSLIVGSAGDARATNNQGVSGFCPVLRSLPDPMTQHIPSFVLMSIPAF